MWDLIVSVPDHCLSFYYTVFSIPFSPTSFGICAPSLFAAMII